MSERTWLVRGAIARILSDAPAPPATWFSVGRRALVVGGLFAYGLAFDNLGSAVLACFGAVQIGLMEAALPFRRMITLLLPLLLACTLAVAGGMLVGQTWLAVIAISGLAYVFGCTAGLSAKAMTIGISSLALSVIFAGLPRPPAEIPSAVGWVVLGMVIQAGLSLIIWHTERRRFAQRAIANKLHAVMLMLAEQSVDPESLVRVHSQGDVAADDIRAAEFPAAEDARLRRAFSASIVATRAVISWMVIDQPGDEERIRAGLRVAAQRRRLDAIWPRLAPKRSDIGPISNSAVEESLIGLERAVDALYGEADIDQPLVGAAIPAPPPPRTSPWKALLPGSAHSRDGLRMALGVGVAEALSVAYSAGHSFWLPLTVVFVLRPTWSLTVVRGLNRTIGNLGALLLLPFIFTSLGPTSWGLVLMLCLLAGVTYRWFFGNYVIASFGLAGTILLLDFAQNPNPDLFVLRLTATILGTVVAILAIVLVPGWRRDVAPEQARALIEGVRVWSRHVRSRIQGAPDVTLADLEADANAGRRCLLVLEPTMVGVLLEPGNHGRPVPLAMLFAAGSRMIASLMAVTYALLAADHHRRTMTAEQRSRLITLSNVEGAGADFDRAAEEYAAAQWGAERHAGAGGATPES